MNAIFKKLNFKDQPVIYVLNAPSSFRPMMEEMKDSAEVRESLAKVKDAAFAIAFATKQVEVDQFAALADRTTVSDAVIWIAYPKGTSKKYKCEFNRDSGWTAFGARGFEPVRQVAIDEDWSALRFRRVEHIKTMTRSVALTETGKQRIGTGKK